MVNKIFNVLLSEKTRKQIEVVILSIAVVSFVVHLIGNPISVQQKPVIAVKIVIAKQEKDALKLIIIIVRNYIVVKLGILQPAD